VKKTHERPLMITEAKHISKGPNNKMKVSANVVQHVMKESSALSILRRNDEVFDIATVIGRRYC
jgi:hypothetical protein